MPRAVNDYSWQRLQQVCQSIAIWVPKLNIRLLSCTHFPHLCVTSNMIDERVLKILFKLDFHCFILSWSPLLLQYLSGIFTWLSSPLSFLSFKRSPSLRWLQLPSSNCPFAKLFLPSYSSIFHSISLLPLVISL